MKNLSKRKMFAVIALVVFSFGVSSAVLGVTDEYGIPVEKPQECVRILQDFKLNITTRAGTAPAEVLFERGAIVAASKIEASGDALANSNVKCSHILGSEKIDTSCPATKVEKASKCYVLVNGDFGGIVLLNTITNISNWVFYLVLILSTIMIVFGGFTYISAAGDPTKSAKGKSIITYALIGLAVALLAKVLPSMMKFFLGL